MSHDSLPSDLLSHSRFLSNQMKMEATPQEAAQYIVQICGELQAMAQCKELSSLVYLLAAVRQEALEFLLGMSPPKQTEHDDH